MSKRDRTAYRRYLDAKCKPTPDGCYSETALGAMQWEMLQALQSGNPLPNEMQMDLAFAFENLCAGVSDRLLTPIRSSSGGAPVRPIKEYLRKDAIRYLRWVDAGDITDPMAVKTIAAAFNVTEKTVNAWFEAWGDKPTPALFEAFEKAGEVEFDKAKAVKALMVSSGRRYGQKW